MPKQFPQVKAGEWVQPVPKAYKMECCDCGLVHSLHFRIHNGKVQFKAYRDERVTRKERQRRFHA